MSPTIRVDEDVYGALQQEAEPFVDTPNTVLRRFLGLTETAQETPSSQTEDESPAPIAKSSRRKKKKKRTRAPSGSLLAQREYELPLLKTLEELDGSAPAGLVIERLGHRLGGQLTPTDLETLDSGVVRWHNRAQFVRFELVRLGYMKNDSPRGVWEISDNGKQRLFDDEAL